MKAYTENGGQPSSAGASQGATRWRIRGLTALPPLPRQTLELLEILTDPDLNILRLVDLVEQTPALAARILGVATSPFFRSPLPVRGLSDAIIRVLGLNLVRDLALSSVLSQPFDVRRCRAFDPMRYWRHALMTAILAQSLAPLVKGAPAVDASDAYLGGLLHSLGLLALAHVAPLDMDRVFARAETSPESVLSDLELESLGLDHAAAGAEIARVWHLPETLCLVMAHHRDPAYRGDHWPLVALVTLADSVSRSRLRGEPPSEWGGARRSLRDTLGIRGAVWDPVIERWSRQVERIADLAAVLAGVAR